MILGNALKSGWTKVAVVAVAVGMFAMLTGEQAQAQRCGTGYGGRYYNGNNFNRGYGRYYNGNSVRFNVGRVSFSFGTNNGYYRNYGNRPRHVYHDTSHWHYVPTRHYRHGNHFDVVPGHYRYHRTGHWHHYHR